MSYSVRSSKFRHVFGEPKKPDQCWQELRDAKLSGEGQGIKGNSKFWAVAYGGGGGPLAVFNHEKPGRVGRPFVLAGHGSHLVDFDFCPFDEHQVATGSDDCTVKIWQIPEGGLTENINEPLLTLEGHQKKVCLVEYHKTADGILTTGSHDGTLRLWDINQGVEINRMEAPNPWALSYNYVGSQFVSTHKDKVCRVWDPRQAACAAEFEAHVGGKPQKCVWLGNKDMIVTTGFSKQSDRQIILRDPRNLETPLNSLNVDVAAGMLFPMYDEDTSLLFVAGKGDSSIRAYEITDDPPHRQNENICFSSNQQHKAICMLPKLAGDVMKCEIARMLRLSGDTLEVVPMIVPRKSSEFQEDIFPDTRSLVPPMSSEQWLGGQDSPPVLRSVKPGEDSDAPAPARKPVKSVLQLSKELEEKDAIIAQLQAKVAELEAKLGA